MGYFKNQLIADQVELGDRVPPPIPARRHLAYPRAEAWERNPVLPKRKAIRERQAKARKLLRRQMRAELLNLWALVILAGVTGGLVGFLIGGVVFG